MGWKGCVFPLGVLHDASSPKPQAIYIYCKYTLYIICSARRDGTVFVMPSYLKLPSNSIESRLHFLRAVNSKVPCRFYVSLPTRKEHMITCASCVRTSRNESGLSEAEYDNDVARALLTVRLVHHALFI